MSHRSMIPGVRLPGYRRCVRCRWLCRHGVPGMATMLFLWLVLLPGLDGLLLAWLVGALCLGLFRAGIPLWPRLRFLRRGAACGCGAAMPHRCMIDGGLPGSGRLAGLAASFRVRNGLCRGVLRQQQDKYQCAGNRSLRLVFHDTTTSLNMPASM